MCIVFRNKKMVQNRTHISDDEDEPYVIDFFIYAESYNLEEQDIKIVVSTRRLFVTCKKPYEFCSNRRHL